jgi:hypothetical protein
VKTLAIILMMVFAIAGTTPAQSSSDFDAKYHRVTSYELRPGVLMTPRYAADGRVCQLTLEKRQQRGDQIVFGVSFSEKEIKELTDELVPESERGENLTERLNVTVDGGFITTDYTYQNVLIRVNGVTRPAPAGNMIVTVTWRNRVCGQGSEAVPPSDGTKAAAVKVP